MRLSEAIRLGSLLAPQVRKVRHMDGGSCALGAAEDAIGGKLCEDEYPWILTVTRPRLKCPACEEYRSVPGVVIVHLNDDHEWTRERIADWVETVEPQPVAEKVEVTT